MTDFIRLTDVCKSYTRGKESISIFDRLNLVIPKGDFVAIMGPSGSGKTTLLNLLGGTDRCDSGQISFDGERIEGYSEGQLTAWRARNVGFIFQFYNLMPILTAAQNVELPLLLTSLPAQRRKENVTTALKIVDLADRARHKPKELSGGQQQRVLEKPVPEAAEDGSADHLHLHRLPDLRPAGGGERGAQPRDGDRFGQQQDGRRQQDQLHRVPADRLPQPHRHHSGGDRGDPPELVWRLFP